MDAVERAGSATGDHVFVLRTRGTILGLLSLGAPGGGAATGGQVPPVPAVDGQSGTGTWIDLVTGRPSRMPSPREQKEQRATARPDGRPRGNNPALFLPREAPRSPAARDWHEKRVLIAY